MQLYFLMTLTLIILCHLASVIFKVRSGNITISGIQNTLENIF